MQSGAKLLMGTKDFSTFRASSCSAKSPIKKLSLVKIKKVKEKVEITFTSKSFLQQQVRSMVGCLKYLGEGKWTVKEFDTELTREIVDLIDREADMLNRGRSESSLDGLR